MKRAHCIAFLISFASGLLAASPALRASLVADFQDRLVQAQAGASDFGILVSAPQDTRIAPDFGPFDQLAQASAATGTATASASSGQTSSIAPTRIDAMGNLIALGSATSLAGNPGANGQADNRFNVFFILDTPQPFSITTSLDGAISGEFLGAVFGRIRLILEVDPFTTILDRQLPTDTGTVVTSGVLDAGRYQLLAEFSVGGVLVPDAQDGASFTGNANYEVHLAVPEPSGLTALGTAALLLRRRPKSPPSHRS
jgi:hypothetical protein